MAQAKALFNEPRQTEDQGREQLAAFAKTFSNKAEWEARAARNRDAMLKAAHLAPLPARCPLNPIVGGKQDRKGYSVENFAIEVFPGFYYTGNLYRPAGGTKPFAGVLCPHGHAGGKASAAASRPRLAICKAQGKVTWHRANVLVRPTAPGMFATQ